MKIAVIDIETTGLDPYKDQILEVGCVIETWPPTQPIANLPKWQAYVLHERLTGNPFALNMNKKIVEYIAKPDKFPELTFVDPAALALFLEGFLLKEEVLEKNREGKMVANCAGKNFAKFDWPFLEEAGVLRNWTPRHRVLDPMPLYLQWEDQQPPSLDVCLERAGIKKDRFEQHTAIGDCHAVTALLRRGLEKLVPNTLLDDNLR